MLPKRSDDAALILGGPAASVWDLLGERQGVESLRTHMLAQFPTVSVSELDDAIAEVLALLQQEGLLDEPLG